MCSIWMSPSGWRGLYATARPQDLKRQASDFPSATAMHCSEETLYFSISFFAASALQIMDAQQDALCNVCAATSPENVPSLFVTSVGQTMFEEEISNFLAKNSTTGENAWEIIPILYLLFLSLSITFSISSVRGIF